MKSGNMQEYLLNILTQFPFLAPFIFIVVRAVAIIFPPIPGIVIDLIGVAIFPWFLGLVYGEIGVLLGAMVAFLIARRFREPLLKKFVPLNKINEWEKKLSENQEFWFLVGLRLFFNPLFDYISYAAGLTKITWTRYLVTTVIGTLPTMFVVYYFGNLSFSKGILYTGAFIGVLFIVSLIYKLANGTKKS